MHFSQRFWPRPFWRAAAGSPRLRPAAEAGDAFGLPAQVEKIKNAGVLKVGVKEDVPKFGYLDPAKNVHEGMEIDLAKRIAKEIFGDETKVEFTGVNAKTRGPALDNGEIDMVIATFTITEERKLSWNFSDPYFTDYVGFLVLEAAASSPGRIWTARPSAWRSPPPPGRP